MGICLLLALLSVGCAGRSPAQPVLPAALPTELPDDGPPPPEMAPPLVISPQAGSPADSAFFYLTVRLEDQDGAPVAGLVTVSWPGGASFIFGPATHIEIPIQLLPTAPHFLVTVEKDGYLTRSQPFDVTLSEDLAYEWVARLQWVGRTA